MAGPLLAAADRAQGKAWPRLATSKASSSLPPSQVISQPDFRRPKAGPGGSSALFSVQEQKRE